MNIWMKYIEQICDVIKQNEFEVKKKINKKMIFSILAFSILKGII